MMIRRGLVVSIPRACRILRPTVILVRGSLSTDGPLAQDGGVRTFERQHFKLPIVQSDADPYLGNRPLGDPEKKTENHREQPAGGAMGFIAIDYGLGFAVLWTFAWRYVMARLLVVATMA